MPRSRVVSEAAAAAIDAVMSESGVDVWLAVSSEHQLHAPRATIRRDASPPNAAAAAAAHNDLQYCTTLTFKDRGSYSKTT